MSDSSTNGGNPSAPGSDPLAAAFDRIAALLEFPADFPLKVMGRRVDDFAQQIVDVARRHVPELDAAAVELRPSSQGNWISLTLPLRVDSREQLEALYRELASHPLVRVVL